MKLALKYGRGSLVLDTPPSRKVNVVDHGRPPLSAAGRDPAGVARRTRIVLVSDLGEVEVRRMGIEPRRTLDEASASLPGGSELFCHVVPEGSKMLVREG